MAEVALPQITTFGNFLDHKVKRINAVYGGAGSGKSMAIAQEMVLKFLEEDNIRILITRKTLPSLRITAYTMIREILAQLGVSIDLDKSNLIMKYRNNVMLFKSLDDPEKIKSAEFNYIWVEEATEISRDDLKQLNLRLRRPNKNGQNRMYLTFNPIDAYHHLITDVIDGTSETAWKREDVAVHHSTYKDNKFLSEDYVENLLNLQKQDPNYYRIYTLGEPGILKNTIFTNYEVFEGEFPYKGDIFYGLDFGFNNPTALIQLIHVDEELYLRELLYKAKMTNADLIGALREHKVSNSSPIYADSAEPQRIQEIRQAGFNIHPSEKDIALGIDRVKRHRLHIDPESVNLISEIRGYHFREDKDGRVLEEPVKYEDHLMDAMRYAIATHIKVKTAGSRFPVIGGTRKW